MHQRLVLAVALFVALGVAAPHALGQTIGVVYQPGWNMVGGPPGTSFSTATEILVYGPNGYSMPAGSSTGGCQGYWAWFKTQTTVSLPSNAVPGSTQNCTLSAGWNLVGNPFSVPVALPTGLLAYHWNPATGRYDVVTTIPVGGAVWIEAAQTGTLTLQIPGATATPTSSPTATQTPAPAVIISSLPPSSNVYTLHVGQTIELLLPSVVGYVATVYPPGPLQLQSAGFTGPLSCSGDPSCSLDLVNQFWIWQAVTPGTTRITVAQACSFKTPPCSTTPTVITVVVEP